MMSNKRLSKCRRGLPTAERCRQTVAGDNGGRGALVRAVRVSLNEGRTIEQKRAFYEAVADRLNQRLHLRREDVFISLVGAEGGVPVT
jgi:hypothetical protein